MREAFAVQKLLSVFNKNYWRISDTHIQNVNKMLTNKVVSFEQPDHGVLLCQFYTMYSTALSRIFHSG